MLRSCLRGVAVAGLAAGLCVPAFAQASPGSGGRQFTQSEHLMHHIIASHYGLTHQQVMDLHGRGYSYEDIATAANIAARSGRPLTDVIAMRDRRMEWPAIASSYGMSEADLYRPPASRVAGARTEMMAGQSNYALPNTDIDWSRTYELTPLEMKRLRAKGLRDREIFVAANAAAMTGRPVDEFVDRIFRGETTVHIAREHNLSVSSLEDVKPEWRTPEWERAVEQGAWTFPRAGTTPGSSTRTMP
jgi:hypothetical protein